MEDIVIIKVVDPANNLDFEIPIVSGAGSPLSIDKSLSDLTNLTVKSGVKSINFKVPITKELAIAYDNFNSSLHHNYKDVDSDKDASIIINGNEVERGKIRLVSSTNTDSVEDAQLFFFGNNFGWTELLKDFTLADLTWVNNSITYSPNTIKDSWLNTVDNGDEWVFPLENRGGRKIANMVHTEDFRPALFFSKILERAFFKIGYTFDGTFITTSKFKKLVLTHFGERFRHPRRLIEENKVIMSLTEFVRITSEALNTPFYFLNPMVIGQGVQRVHDEWDDFTPPNKDDENNFDATGGTIFIDLGVQYPAGRFVAPVAGNYKFNLSIEGFTYNESTLGTGKSWHTFFLREYDAAGVTQPISGYIMPNQFIGSITGVVEESPQEAVSLSGEVTISLKAGEGAELWALHSSYDPATGFGNRFDLWEFQIDSSRCTIELESTLIEGTPFNFTNILDDKVKILDIINDFSRMFNIFWDTDLVLKKIIIETRDDFYDPIEDAVDFTDRVDLLSPIKTSFNSSSHKKTMVFAYAKDGNDIYVQGRDKDMATTLAEYTHGLPSKFTEGVTTIACSVLAATYYLKDTDSIAIVDRLKAPYTARYWNEFTSEIPEEIFDNNAPRLLNYEYLRQNGDGTKTGGADIFKFRFYDEAQDRELIPYVLPHQIKIGSAIVASTDFNLYWHSIFNQNGLFIDYWSKTITEIINGTNVICKMLFNAKQWSDFKFKVLAYFDQPIDLKGYWIVEKLMNYQPENSKLIKTKLLKRVEYDVQVEAVTVIEDEPVGGSNERKISSSTVPRIDGRTSSLEMTITVNDGDGNEIEVPMTTENLNGTKTTMKI